MPAAHDLRDLALATGAPVATVLLHEAGGVTVTWANRSLVRLLGADDHGNADGDGLPLADLLTEGSRARLAALVRELVAHGGRAASVQLAAGTQEIRAHLVVRQADPPSGAPLEAVLHAEGVVRQPAAPGGEVPDRVRLVDRLDGALRRLRRRPSRVALALATVHRDIAGDSVPVDPTSTAVLLERVRAAARETDTVALLAAGSIAVLAEEAAEDGGIAMARRLLAVLHGSPADESRRIAHVTLLDVDVPHADAEAVLQHLEDGAVHRAEGGLTVLDSWRPGDRAPGSADAGERLRTEERIRAALASGRFVLRFRPVLPLGAAPAAAEEATAATVLAEVCTVDDGVVAPVRVDAPGLAVALDRWALHQVAQLVGSLAARRVVVRLQPAGQLAPLGAAAAALRTAHGDREWVLQVPEARLAQAVSAQHALVRDLPELGTGLAVADWTGALDVRSLVQLRLTLVGLALPWGRDVLGPDGRAALTGLVAGLRAGLGPGVPVVAEQPPDPRSVRALAACGVGWGAPRYENTAEEDR